MQTQRRRINQQELATLQIWLMQMASENKLPRQRAAITTLVETKGYNVTWNSLKNILEAMNFELERKQPVVKLQKKKPSSYGKSTRAVAWCLATVLESRTELYELQVSNLDGWERWKDAELLREIIESDKMIIVTLRDIFSGRGVDEKVQQKVMSFEEGGEA
jgi:uncharacterized lipoprotein